MMTMAANIKTPRYLVSRWPSQAQVSASFNHRNQYQKTGMEINKLVVDSRYAPKLSKQFMASTQFRLIASRD